MFQSRAAIVAALIAGTLYWFALDGRKTGFYHDDGIYIVTAKSIAEGSGYKILSLPAEPNQTKYPPAYPALLSIAWLINPSFPANALLFLIPSAVATVLYVLLARRYLIAELGASDNVALLCVLLTAFNQRTLLLASSAMSEAVFTLVSILALWACTAEFSQRSVRTRVAACILMAVLVLTRTSGVSLLVAVGLYAVLRRKPRNAAAVLITGVLVLGTWTYWSQTHQTANAALSFYTSYGGDLKEIVKASGSAGFIALLAQHAFMLIPMSIPVVTLGMAYSSIAAMGPGIILLAIALLLVAFAVIAWGFINHFRQGLQLVHVYIGCYLAIHLLWPYSSYDRFLMPLLPFWAFFFITGLERLVPRLKVRVAAVMLLGLILFLVYQDARGFSSKAVQSRAAFAARTAQEEQLGRWIQANTRSSDILLCYPDPRCYLSYGRKAVAVELLGHVDSDAKSLISRIVDLGVSYVVASDMNELAKFRPDLRIRGFDALLHERDDLLMPVFSLNGATVYRVVQLSSSRIDRSP